MAESLANRPENQPQASQGNQGFPQNNPYQSRAFSGIPQDVMERAEKTDFLPYEKIEIEEASEHKGISEPHIVDSEQDAGIVSETAKEVLKLEAKAEMMSGTAIQIPQEESGEKESPLLTVFNAQRVRKENLLCSNFKSIYFLQKNAL